jgi:hypothetical protein
VTAPDPLTACPRCGCELETFRLARERGPRVWRCLVCPEPPRPMKNTMKNTMTRAVTRA